MDHEEGRKGTKMRRIGIGLGVVLLTMLAGPASATFIMDVVGDPVVCGDVAPDPWTQSFVALQTDLNDNLFTYLQVLIISGPTPATHFQLPPISPHSAVYNTAASGWSQVYSSATLVAAAGPATHDQQFSLDFSGLLSDNTQSHPLEFVVEAYSGDTWVSGMYVEYYSQTGQHPNHWYFEDTIEPVGPPPVPEPFSMMMLGCLGAGMTVVRKLKRHKTQ
jgi:hypothetical protein